MLTEKQAETTAIANTIPDGIVYYSAEAEDFYIFTIVPKGTPLVEGLMTGSTFTAVNKDDGEVWTVKVTDPRLNNLKTLQSPAKNPTARTFKVRR